MVVDEKVLKLEVLLRKFGHFEPQHNHTSLDVPGLQRGKFDPGGHLRSSGLRSGRLNRRPADDTDETDTEMAKRPAALGEYRTGVRNLNWQLEKAGDRVCEDDIARFQAGDASLNPGDEYECASSRMLLHVQADCNDGEKASLWGSNALTPSLVYQSSAVEISDYSDDPCDRGHFYTVGNCLIHEPAVFWSCCQSLSYNPFVGCLLSYETYIGYRPDSKTLLLTPDP